MTSVGGLLGVASGILFSLSVAALFPNLPAHVSIFWTVIGLMLSVAVGLFFGIYPAVKAAAMDPVRCLRYE
jgi:putative ABC transport system permease protein